MSKLSAPHFHDETAAIERLESIIWPAGPVCPHCGNTAGERITKVGGKTARPGLKRCLECKRQFTVKIGTLFESSHIPVYKWWQAVHLMTSSKKGISSHQLHRTLEVTYKTAWFMSHRIREAMSEGYVRSGPLGGLLKVVEADETFLGPNPKKDSRVQRKREAAGLRGPHHKMIVYSLIERGGKVRSFHIRELNQHTVMGIMQDQVDANTAISTDEGMAYAPVRRLFLAHGTVNHSAKQYRYGNAHTNTVESYFSVLKRGLNGTYQHVSAKHLRRYCDEFDFRHNNRTALGVDDEARTIIALAGIKGKRLTYRRAGGDAAH